MKTYPMSQLISNSELETFEIGRALGQHLESFFVIGLTGTLGSGKTRLSQGVAAGLGIDPETVTSPTFTICVPYTGRLPLLHLDAYRIQTPEEVDELGLDEAVESGSVLLIEWAEKIEDLIPPRDLQILIRQTGERQRTLELSPRSESGQRCVGRLLDRIAKEKAPK